MQATRRPRAAARGPASGHTRPGPRGRQTIPAGRRRCVAPAGLAGARIRDADGGTRSLLHVVTDWPGYFPGGPQIVRLLIDAGADPNAAVTGSWHAETPLHWAASSDDSDVAAALIDGGADIPAPAASVAARTPVHHPGGDCFL